MYRIVKGLKRTDDLSGMGAYLLGGRWNSKGTYLLYTSENSSLALIENLVHFEPDLAPPSLFLMHISIDVTDEQVYVLPDALYPKFWQEVGNLENRSIGDGFLAEKKYLAMKVRSSINSFEYNYLLNPLFARYHDLIELLAVHELTLDGRLLR